MAKMGCFVSLLLLSAAGCATMENPATVGEQPVAAAAISETPDQSGQTIAPADKNDSAKLATSRMPTQEDIRRLQLRLRDVGINAGAADGIAGAKTKVALSRFQSGCALMKPVLENFANDGGLQPLVTPAPGVTLQMSKSLTPEQTQEIQAGLKKAGFDPGPIDGIFGAKTKSILVQLRAGCPMISEFSLLLTNQVQTTEKEPVAAPALARARASAAPLKAAGTVRSDAGKPAIAVNTAASQEDIRILQLRLRDAGFDPGPFDGVMGPKTKSALQQYRATQQGKQTKLSLSAGIAAN